MFVPIVFEASSLFTKESMPTISHIIGGNKVCVCVCVCGVVSEWEWEREREREREILKKILPSKSLCKYVAPKHHTPIWCCSWLYNGKSHNCWMPHFTAQYHVESYDWIQTSSQTVSEIQPWMIAGQARESKVQPDNKYLHETVNHSRKFHE